MSPNAQEMKAIITVLESIIEIVEANCIEFNFMNRKFEKMPYAEPLTRFESEIITAFKSLDYPKLERYLGAN